MCANWIVSVGKLGAASAAGNNKMGVAPCHFHVASESDGKCPQWRFSVGDASSQAPARNAGQARQARHVLHDVLSKLIDQV